MLMIANSLSVPSRANYRQAGVYSLLGYPDTTPHRSGRCMQICRTAAVEPQEPVSKQGFFLMYNNLQLIDILHPLIMDQQKVGIHSKTPLNMKNILLSMNHAVFYDIITDR
jgi:hypothetical protein